MISTSVANDDIADDAGANDESQDIAIIGASLHLPQSRSMDEFWGHLAAGRSLISEVPARRWRKEDHFGDPRRDFNKTNSVWGGFVDDVESFDADFFEISPREVQSMDPQQRMAMELSWQALEDAGYRADRLAGSRTGVFMGVCHWDYAELIEQEVAEIDAYYPTGVAYAIIANRVSHYFDFRGPSVVNDTACASSLVAVQQAVQALLSGDCDYALAGGVNLCWSPRHFIAFSKAGMLSRDGLCRAFDADANGYVRGEGGGIFVLKRAADARRDGDAIHAVIKGIGSNHGGRTSSLTVTNPKAQAQLITEIYRRAQVKPETVSYIEAHGPGTRIGDPIEVRGLKKAFADLRDSETADVVPLSCGIGSVKTNIGHLEGAAGVAGMLKVILAMRHRQLPQTVNFRQLNPLIKLEGSPFYIVDRLTDWNVGEQAAPLRAGVSSFGFGGTNVHVLLESPEQRVSKKAEEVSDHPGEQWLPVSARDEDRLREICAGLARWVRGRLEQGEGPLLADIAQTLHEGRVSMQERVVFQAGDLETWASQLECVAAGEQLSVNCWSGRLLRPDETWGVLDAGDVVALGARWVEQGLSAKFAQAWAEGLPLDWSQWPAVGNRLHMPGYVFARTPHWFRPSGGPVPNPSEVPSGPTISQASSLGEGRKVGGAWHFPLRFDAAQSFVRDHVVNHVRIVPGVVALELVMAALQRDAIDGQRRGMAPGIRNAVWIRPLLVNDTELHAELRLAANGEGHDFAIVDEAGTPYTSGRVEYSDVQAESMDLSALRQRHTSRIDVARGYAALWASGIEHGPSLQGLEAMYGGPEGVLAKLRLPADAPSELTLQPAILDSALQAALAMGPDGQGWQQPSVPAVPFALDSLKVYAATTRTMWAWLRHGQGKASLPKLDIDLFDEAGRLCVRLTGYTSRALVFDSRALASDSRPLASDTRPLAVEREDRNGPAAAGAPVVSRKSEGTAELIEVTRVWCEEAASVTECATPLVLNAALHGELVLACAARLGIDVRPLPMAVAGGGGDPRIEAAEMKAAFDACYGHVQQILNGRGSTMRRVLIVAPGSMDSSVYAPLAAVLKSAHQENPSFKGKLVMIDGFDPRDTARFERVVQAEAAADDDVEVAYDRQDHRWRCETVELPRDTADGASLIREGGVYWITGGAGGLGQLLTERLCRRYRATVVVSGRSTQSVAIDALRSRLSEGQCAGRVVYRQVDVTVAESVHDTAASIRLEFGRIDGVFHAAGVLDDGYLASRPLARTAPVLAPKVDGTAYIDLATRDHGMDFLMLFGSVAGAFGNAAQVDYAAANAFLSSYAVQRPASGSVVRVVEWPLWAEGGMQVDDASLAYLRKQTGTVPLPSEAGLDALERALRAEGPVRRAVLFGELPKLRVYAGLVRSVQAGLPAATGEAQRVQRAQRAPLALDENELIARTQDYVRDIFAVVTRQDPENIQVDEKLERYGIDSIAIVELTSRFEDTLGSLPKTLLFEYVDVQGVAGYFIAEHRDRLLQLFAPAPVEESIAEPSAAFEPVAEPSVAFEPVAATAMAAKPVADEPSVPHVVASRSDAERHDIAVVGMAGRYPGADTLEEFWEQLSDGRHSFESVPASRWRHSDIYFGERDVLGKTVVKTGTFLRDIEAFDPRYFNISQRDAELLSPEVRLFMQAGVTALEDAGYSSETLRRRYDSDVGVLVGSMNNSYSLYGFQNMLRRGSSASGSEIGVIANMLSYYYGFTGPSMFVDTMCSSSSACVHQAVRMLRDGECRMVVVGGVNLMAHPFDLISTSQAHFTTKTAEVVRSYGLGADGTILGEGVGAVVLKPLAEAIADGDHVYGVIKGTGLTNAGVRNGFTVPSPKMQGRAIERALDDAGVDARTISYLEGHGSATSLGDPIEIKGASLAFARHTEDLQFCALGSVKSNVAHLLSASGLVGLTKVLLQLKHRTLAPSLHSETLSSAIDFAKTPFRVQQHRAAWERPLVPAERGGMVEMPRRAGITSIGAGGVNVHIVVEEHDGQVAAAPESGRPQLLVFSAMTPKALADVLLGMLGYATKTELSLDALAYGLQTGKNELPCRLAVVAADLAEAMSRLERLRGVDWTANTPTLPEGVHYTASTLRQRRRAEPAVVQQALQHRNLDVLAQCWTSGASLDWDRLWPTGSRPAKLSLPEYPFDRVRCWYPEDEDAPSVLRPLSFTQRAHPWVGSNQSDLHGVRYALTLRADELLDYVYTVGRTRHYVTLALLDAASAFAALAGLDNGSLRVENARWGALPSPGDAPTELEWRLRASAGGRHRVELWHLDDAVPTLRFAADVVAAAPTSSPMPELLSAGELRSLAELLRTPATLDHESFYAKLSEVRVDARPYAQCVEGATELDGQRLLLRVGAPASCQDSHKQRVRIPAWVLSSIVQGVLYLHGVAGLAEQGGLLGAAELDSLYGDGLERTRAILMSWESGASWRIRATLLDEHDQVLGQLDNATFSNEPLPPSLRGESGQTLIAVAPLPPAQPAVGENTSLIESIRETVADLLKFELVDIDIDTHFYSFGFESLSLVALSVELNALLRVDLTPAIFFECPNIRSLSEHLVSQYGANLNVSGAPPAAALPAATPPPAASLVSAATSWPSTALPPASPLQRAEPPMDDDAVAIVGAAGRFPGAQDLDAFWQRLREGADMVTAYPDGRFGDRYTETVRRSDFPKWAGQIDEVDRFDADFFSLSRLEAELMDPQHRLALESVWAAMENGGYAPARLPENTGVFFGVSGNDYHQLLNASGVAPDGYIATGNAHSMLANRISFLLDIHGPSEPVDTACSSSLVALDHAVQSIRAGRCDMAIAGGVNLLFSVDTFAATHMSGMLSPDGRCKTFSAQADGYVRGEGVAAVLLKPLAQAQRDGDAIWGVIIGSAVNHGGRANSLTAPNGKTQAALIEQAMHRVDPDSIGYIEAHGTGTSLGDPVEVNALNSAYRALRAHGTDANHAIRNPAPALGSVKTNIGHLESAAGMAGLLKVLLAMREGELPATLHCAQLNPHLPTAGGGFEVVRELRRWEPRIDPSGRRWPLRAGVSSFGFGGANAHIVLEAPPAPPIRPGHPDGPQAIVLSARDARALDLSAERLCEFLAEAARADRIPALADLAFTLQLGREAMEERLGFVASTVDEVRSMLRRFLAGGEPSQWQAGSMRRSRGSGVQRDSVQTPEIAQALQLGQLDRVTAAWCQGDVVDWRTLHPTGHSHTVRLPAYPFARERYWVPASLDPTPAPPPAQTTFDLDAYASVLDEVLDSRLGLDALIEPQSDLRPSHSAPRALKAGTPPDLHWMMT